MPDTATKHGDSLLGSGMVYALATVAPVLVALLITPLVTRALGADGYGFVGIGITLYQFGSIILGLGLSAAITRHAIIGRSGIDGAVALVFIGALAGIALGIVVALLVPIWGPMLAGTHHDMSGFVWPVLSSVSLSVLTLCQSVFRALSQVKTFVALGVLSAFAAPGLGYLLILAIGPTPTAYLAGLALGQSVAALAALFLLPRITLRAFSFRDFVENMKVGLPTVPHSVAAALLATVLVIAASQLGGVAEAGRLQLALFLGMAPLTVLGAFNNAWAPMVYRTDPGSRVRVISVSMRAIAVLVFCLSAGFCVLIEPVARFVAGPQIYNDALLQAALVTAAAAPLMALYLANINLVFLSGRTALLAVTTPSSLIAAVVVMLAAWAGLGHDLWVLALGVPLFQLSQFAWSVYLRRHVGAPSIPLHRALPALGLAFAMPCVMLVVRPDLVMLTAAAAVCAGLLVVLERRALSEMR